MFGISLRMPFGISKPWIYLERHKKSKDLEILCVIDLQLIQGHPGLAPHLFNKIGLFTLEKIKTLLNMILTNISRFIESAVTGVIF